MRVARHSLFFFQIWLLVGRSAEEMLRFILRVRCILTDMGTERLMANMADCFPKLFQLMGAPAQGLPRRTRTFDLCLHSPGWMHQWDVIHKRGVQLIAVVPVLVRWRECSGQFLSVVHDGIPTLQSLKDIRAAASES